MTILRRAPLGVLLSGVLGLAACGSDSGESRALLQSLPSQFGMQSEPATVITREQAAATLQATPNPVILFDLQDREAQFLAVEIQRNGPYRTFASASRQSVTVRDGLVTATRGLGGDLMSSETDALLAQVTGRKRGNILYVQRYLTSDDQTVTRSYVCAVLPGETDGGHTPASTGAGLTVSVACSGDGAAFTNVYVVDASGRITSSRQWLGDMIGYMGTQPLRL